MSSRGPFLERPGNLTGPESDFDIKASRKVGCVLTSDKVHSVSLPDNFTAQFSNLLKLSSRMEKKMLNGPGNNRELRETGPWSHFSYLRIHGHMPRSHVTLNLNTDAGKVSYLTIYSKGIPCSIYLIQNLHLQSKEKRVRSLQSVVVVGLRQYTILKKNQVS